MYNMVNPYINYGLIDNNESILVYCLLKKWTALVQMLIIREAAEVGGDERVNGNPLYFPLDFSANLKLL